VTPPTRSPIVRPIRQHVAWRGMYRRPGVWRYAPGEFLKMGDWMEKRKTVMLLGNGKRIIIKVKADKGSKKKIAEIRPVVPAGMTPNRLHNVRVTESKHLVWSPRRGSVPRPTAD